MQEISQVTIFLARFLILAPFIFAALYLFLKKDRGTFVQIVLGVAFVNVLSMIAQTLIPEQRPYIGAGFSPGIITLNTGSFFSGHTASLFVLGTVLWSRSKRLSIFSFLIGLMVGYLRVVIKVHYPIDIAGGIVFGILVGFAVVKAFNRDYPDSGLSLPAQAGRFGA